MNDKQIVTILEFTLTFLDPARFTPCRIAGVTELVEAITAANIPVDARDSSAVRFSILGAASKGFEVAGVTRKDGNWEKFFEVVQTTLVELFPNLAADFFNCTRKQAVAAIHVAVARLSVDEAVTAAPAEAPTPVAASVEAPPPVQAAPVVALPTSPKSEPPTAPIRVNTPAPPAPVRPASAAPPSSLVPKPPAAGGSPLKLSTVPGPK